MSEQLTFYKLFAEKHYKIEIPIIQRDYAQGRKSASEVRNVFLEALYSYLAEGTPFRDLDFIYGDIDSDNNFIPLDGQQRLTTLFLLHWYLATKEGKKDELSEVLTNGGFSRFTYKTRQSAADFCNALLKYTVSFDLLLPADDEKENTLSKTITDSSWYFLPWDNDPTVQSMLCMLDSIHMKFKDTNGFYDLLINEQSPIITFQFLPLQDYGLTDDLYIKMNSRGKPLTNFENFKAKFEQHLGQYNGKLNYQPNLQEYFSHRIDTRWADLFWTYRDINENVFDKQIMNFITTIAINHYALWQNDPKRFIDNQDNLPLGFYLKQNEQFISTLIDTLDIISENPSYHQSLPNFFYYNEIESFRNIINGRLNDAGYVERIKLFAYYSFLSKWKTPNGLSDWMRVVVNLTENTAPYNSEVEFVNSLRAIQKLLPNSSQIIRHLTINENITGFNPVQLKEEQIKAYLMLKNELWSLEIYEAEKQMYFKGQITFALAFSGIEDYYDANLNCNWDEEANKQYFQLFSRYLKLVFSLFDNNGLKVQAKENHRLHRALLSKGNYLIYAKSNLSFLNDSDRDVSWKRFLQGDGERKAKRHFFKLLIDDPRFDPADFNSLDLICAATIHNLNGWRKKFVEVPKLLAYLGNFKYIRFENEGKIYLLSGVKMNGEHTELFTYALYLQLNGKISVSPFRNILYYYVNTDKDEPCFYLNDYRYKQNHLELDIYYAGNDSYQLKVFDKNQTQIEKELFNLLHEHDFIAKQNYFELVIPEIQLKDKIELINQALEQLNPANIQ